MTAARTRYDERFLRSIEWGLKLDEQLRPQNVTEWREHFSGRVPMSAPRRLDFGAFSAMMRAGSQLTTRVARTAVPDSAKWL